MHVSKPMVDSWCKQRHLIYSYLNMAKGELKIGYGYYSVEIRKLEMCA